MMGTDCGCGLILCCPWWELTVGVVVSCAAHGGNWLWVWSYLVLPMIGTACGCGLILCCPWWELTVGVVLSCAAHDGNGLWVWSYLVLSMMGTDCGCGLILCCPWWELTVGVVLSCATHGGNWLWVWSYLVLPMMGTDCGCGLVLCCPWWELTVGVVLSCAVHDGNWLWVWSYLVLPMMGTDCGCGLILCCPWWELIVGVVLSCAPHDGNWLWINTTLGCAGWRSCWARRPLLPSSFLNLLVHGPRQRGVGGGVLETRSSLTLSTLPWVSLCWLRGRVFPNDMHPYCTIRDSVGRGGKKVPYPELWCLQSKHEAEVTFCLVVHGGMIPSLSLSELISPPISTSCIYQGPMLSSSTKTKWY